MTTKTILDTILTRILRVFFFFLYGPMAWSYDIVSTFVSWGRWHEWIMTVLPYLKGSRVLEIGYGPGHLQLALQRNGLDVYGIDTSKQMGQLTKKRILKKGFIPKLVRAYAQNFPFPEHSFDQIVASFPTEYIYSKNTMLESFRTLKPGGVLVILPVAWITGTKLMDRGTAALFRITGQSPAWDPQWMVPFEETGFQTEFTIISQNSWSLAIILAKKPGEQITYAT